MFKMFPLRQRGTPCKYLELQQDQETRHHEHKNIQQAYYVMDTLILRLLCLEGSCVGR